jgi:putative Mn2+ efflux pump MntP
MGTNKELLSKGIKYLGGALLLFIGPSIIYNAFINKQNIWHYLVWLLV